MNMIFAMYLDTFHSAFGW